MSERLVRIKTGRLNVQLVSVNLIKYTLREVIQVCMCVCVCVCAGADPELLLGGAPIRRGGRLPNILVIFSEKPYEIKEILVRRGARTGCAP